MTDARPQPHPEAPPASDPGRRARGGDPSTTILRLAAEVRAGTGQAPGGLLGVRGEALRLSLPDAQLGERLFLDDGLIEVVGFEGTVALALPLRAPSRLRSGAAVRRLDAPPGVPPGRAALGRVLDALGEAIDPGPPLPPATWPLRRAAPPLLRRRPVREPMPLGVRAIDALSPLARGQRIALEAGPGLGKSTLLLQIAAQARADAVVMALIGERGRELGDILARLPDAARARTAVVVVPADAPPLAWLRGAEVATALAESLRAEGCNALLLLDSLTRVARAVRTIGVTAGEPTTRRGFPASLGPTIARLLERATNDDRGWLTAIYTVLVEGEASEDPVAEETRALLDGHLVLDARLAAAGRFPALDVTRSVSRCAPSIMTDAQREAATRLRRWLAAHAAHRDAIEVGAYRAGRDADVDAALDRQSGIEAFLSQRPDEDAEPAAALAALTALTATRRR